MNWDFLHVFHWTYVLHAENVGEFLHTLRMCVLVCARACFCVHELLVKVFRSIVAASFRFYHNIMIFE